MTNEHKQSALSKARPFKHVKLQAAFLQSIYHKRAGTSSLFHMEAVDFTHCNTVATPLDSDHLFWAPSAFLLYTGFLATLEIRENLENEIPFFQSGKWNLTVAQKGKVFTSLVHVRLVPCVPWHFVSIVSID